MPKRSLIIFAKLPEPGKVKTRLGTDIGMGAASLIYRRFAEHAFGIADTLQRSRVEIHLFYTPGVEEAEIRKWVGRDYFFHEQEGDTLGTRMMKAFALTFKTGAQESLIVGTDVPELNVDTINSAYDHLSLHDVVIGPSADGGYYLLGMKPPLKDLFEGISWSTDRVFSSTIELIKASNLSWRVLPEAADIDTHKDLLEYLARQNKV